MMSLRSMSSNRLARVVLLAGGILALGVAAADARAGRGGSLGSRGGNTFSTPPATNTAPRSAQPIERSTTQPAVPSPGAQTARPSPQATIPSASRIAPAAGASRFGSGFAGALAGGLLGAGLFGLLTGHGLFGGLSGLAGFLGLALQAALIGGLIWLAVAFMRARLQPAMASAGLGRTQAPAMGGTMQRSGMGAARGPGPAFPRIGISHDDLNTFERILGEVQAAYSNEDLDTLRRLATPEMAFYFAEDLADNVKKGVHNEVSGIKLLQGDVSEAWRQSNAEYATVAMRFELVDATVDRVSGRVLEGNRNVAQEATELWTFRRLPGSGLAGWRLSAIQQTG